MHYNNLYIKNLLQSDFNLVPFDTKKLESKVIITN